MQRLLAEETVRSVDQFLPWLQEAIANFYPESTYSASLDAYIRECVGQDISAAEDQAISANGRSV